MKEKISTPTDIANILNMLGNPMPVAMATAIDTAIHKNGSNPDFVVDRDGFFVEINVSPEETINEAVFLWLTVDNLGHLTVTAKGKDFERSQGWVTTTLEGWFDQFKHPHVTRIGDTLHSHYTHLEDIFQWVREHLASFD